MENPLRSGPPFADLAFQAVKSIKEPLLLYGIVETVVLGFVVSMGPRVPRELVPIVYGLVILPVLVAVGHFILALMRARGYEPPPFQWVFAESDSNEFRRYMEDLALKAQRVVMIGTGLTILHGDPFRKKLMERAAKGDCRLEMYFADPSSPAVQTRLIEEESGDPKPRIAGTGIVTLMESILRSWNDFGRPDTIQVRAFFHYPTFALLIVDDRYFIYPYGYKTLGNLSPVLQFSEDAAEGAPVVAFLKRQYKLVKEDSFDPGKAFAFRRGESGDAAALLPFALYFVPPQDSPLYKFGTEILGYDLYSKRACKTDWKEKVGDAQFFGFHLTVCDALYFLSESELKSVLTEITYLIGGFQVMNLTGLEIKAAFPDNKSISITVEDPSGSLEALHHELVMRVYRRASASNYSLGKAKPVRDPDLERANLMIKRFRAPYILNRYFPHFTLLTNVPTASLTQGHDELKRLFEEKVKENTVRVQELAVMSRPAPGAPWIIKSRIKLG